jgi:UDP-glucose 4-epimerase
MVENDESGTFFPQNSEYVRTAEMVKIIAEAHRKRIRLTKAFNPALKQIGRFVGVVNKVFGNLVYEKSMSEYKENYRIRDFGESIMATEK